MAGSTWPIPCPADEPCATQNPSVTSGTPKLSAVSAPSPSCTSGCNRPSGTGVIGCALPRAIRARRRPPRKRASPNATGRQSRTSTPESSAAA